MINLTEKDLIIIKQSSNWATRSISRIKSLPDTTYGGHLREILNKSNIIYNDLHTIWDNFVSANENRTVQDYKGLSEFAGLKIIFDSIRSIIVRIIVPKLIKDKIDIISVYKKEDEKKSPPKPVKGKGLDKGSPDQNKVEKSEDVSRYIQEISAASILPGFENKQADILRKLHILYNSMQTENISIEDFENKFLAAKKMYLGYLEAIKVEAEKIKPKNSEKSIYSSLIKNASKVEEATYYYLLSLGKYSRIRTPIKDVLTSVKQYIPFVREPADIYSYRRTAIYSTKELTKFAEEFSEVIQEAISQTDKLTKWVMIINKFNDFADQYNSKINFFEEMFESLLLKSKHDKLLRSKKPLKGDQKNQKYELEGFSEYNMMDFSSSARSKFKPIEKITF